MATITGTDGNDTLPGTASDDVINGLAGNDIIDGGFGADVLNGGDGDDLFKWTSVIVTSAPLATGSVDGGPGYDVIDVSGLSPASLSGFTAANGFTLAVGSQRYAVSNVEEIRLGFSADNVSLPSGVSLTLHAGAGNDHTQSFIGQSVYGDAGDDNLFITGAIGSSGVGLVDGGDGIDTLTTNIQFTVDLQAGTAISGGATFTVRNIENVIAPTFDRVSIVRGDSGANTLSVSSFGDTGATGVTFDGRGGDDVLVGSAGADTLMGGDGADTLSGLGGRDALTGGSGNDVFVDSLAGFAGDTITDFSPGDRIDISDVSAKSATYSLANGVLTVNGQTVTLPGFASPLFLHAGINGEAVFSALRDGTSADFSGDGRSDILWRNTNGALSSWTLAGNGSSAQQGAYNGSVATSWRAIETFDFDGDGRSDILWRQDGGAVAIWGSAGAGFNQGTYYRPAAVPTSWRVAGAGDLNGDGKDDLIWQNSDGAISSWTSTGSGFQEAAYTHASVGANWKVAGLADFNGDGAADILWRNTDGSVSMWSNDGTGASFNEGAFYQPGVPTNWHIAGTGDFNGDGKDDILWRNDNGALTEWQSTGSGFNESVFTTSVPTSWHVAQIGDFNNDGKADILWQNDNGAVSTWQSNGSGFDQAIYNSGAPSGWSVVAHNFGG